MFVIGGSRILSCEVFDSCSRKLAILNWGMKVSALEKKYFRAFCVGFNIVAFHHSYSDKLVVYMYNDNKLR